MGIRSNRRQVHETVRIGDGTEIIADEVHIGRMTRIGENCCLVGRKIVIGEQCFIGNSVRTEGGGSGVGPNSNIFIGNECLICDRVILNNSDEIHIGNHSALGAETIIWTHGAFYPALLGGVAVFKPVHVGDYVWIPPRCQILSGVKIGDHVCVGTNSVISKDLPSGCLAWGVPAVILKERYYPRVLSNAEKEKILDQIISDYLPLMYYKGFQKDIKRDELKVVFDNRITFDCDRMEIQVSSGKVDEYSEDLRDYLRRRGIPLYSDRSFQSVIPPTIGKLLKTNKDRKARQNRRQSAE